MRRLMRSTPWMGSGPAAQPLRRGVLLGDKFRIERILGEGGMGAVVEATNLSLGTRVAIKVLLSQAAANEEAHARFIQEARIASQLRSEHVVRVLDLGHTDRGAPFIVMEKLDGRDLASLIAEPGHMHVVDAVRLVTQAAIGVAAAHAAGLVHRDLKPANLFLARQPDNSSIVKVLDFGLSKVMRDDDLGITQSASTFGTPQYMAPEQVMSVKNVDARCDQHALGMILFELLTKTMAFVAPAHGPLMVAIATQPPPSARRLRADIPKTLDEIIQRALAKRPEDRYRNLAAFARALAPFGGADADLAVGVITRTLARTPGTPADAHASPFVPSDARVTVLKRPPTIDGVSELGPVAVSVTNAWSFWAVGGAASIVAGIATVLLVSRGLSAASATEAVASTSEVVHAAATVDPMLGPSAMEIGQVVKLDTAASIPEAARPDDSARPLAPPAKPKRNPKKPATKPPPTKKPPPVDKDPIDVFGGGR